VSARVDFFFSFRSPYSYLAAPRAFGLSRRFDVELVYRGVIPMAMRGQAVPRAKRLHTLRDADREAARLGLPFGRIHDPIGEGAMRCLLVGEHALDVGREREFVLETSRGIWSEAMDVARDEPLRELSERAGLEWRDCLAALGSDELRERVEANTTALDQAGHWGVPLFVFGDELFWGQDRIEDLEDALSAAGLKRP
jgi:2-hydroxychromene-2-carboxylate isomerase